MHQFYSDLDVVFICLPFRAAISCIGGMYEKLGRMVGRSYEETVSILIKALKNAEVCLCIYRGIYPQIKPGVLYLVVSSQAAISQIHW